MSSTRGANTILDIQVKYDGVAQPLQVVGYDGVPAGSQDGKQQGTLVTQTHALLPPAARVEFIVAPAWQECENRSAHNQQDRRRTGLRQQSATHLCQHPDDRWSERAS